MDQPHYLRLSPAVQNYVWGKVGRESEVALLKNGADHVGTTLFTIDEKEHYAEVDTMLSTCILLPTIGMALYCKKKIHCKKSWQL